MGYLNLHADHAELDGGYGKALLDPLDAGLSAELDVALLELFNPVPLACEFPGKDHLTSHGTGLHYPPHGGVAGSSEVPSPFEGFGQLIGHYMGVEARVLHLLHFNLGVVKTELVLQSGGEVANRTAPLADHETGALYYQLNTGSERSPLNVKTTETCPADLFSQVLLKEQSPNILAYEFSFVSHAVTPPLPSKLLSPLYSPFRD